MKTNLIFSLIIVGLLIGCKKESPEPSNALNNKNVQQISKSSRERLLNLVKSQTKLEEKYKSSRQKLDDTRNQANKSFNYEELLFEDFLYLYEGIFAADVISLEGEIEEDQYISQTVTIPIHENGQGELFVYMGDVADYYDDLEFIYNQEISSNEIVKHVAIELISFESDHANLELYMYAGPEAVGFNITPSGPVKGAVNAGWCNSSNPAQVDAAVFLRTYANSQAPHLNGLCPNGVYGIVNLHEYDITNPNDAYFQAWAASGSGNAPGIQYYTQYYFTNVYPKIWMSPTNSCIGHTNQDWYDMYDKMDFFIDFHDSLA